MSKFLLLLGLLPVFVSFVARKFLSDKVVRKEGGEEVSLSGLEMVERVLKKGKAGEVDIQLKKRPFMVLGPDHLVISPSLAESRRARDVAEAGILAGLVLMARRQEKVVGWRRWAVKFGSAMPAFTTIVMFFAMVMGRLSASLCFGVVAASLGLATAFLWFTLPVERAAAGTVAEMLDETALVARRSEGERLANLVRALGWWRIVPGAIAWIAGK
ncbi:zinc metallopeptidase [bacterium]|nr:zinc metallopeptidase [bacterium]